MRQCFLYRMENQAEVRPKKLRVPPRSKASPLKGQLERVDRAHARPEERDIETGAEDAEDRSRSDAKKGGRLLLESE